MPSFSAKANAVSAVSGSVAVAVGFGVPQPAAVLAVLGYQIVHYWVP